MFPTLPTLLRVALVFSVGSTILWGKQKRPRWRLFAPRIACRSRIAPGPSAGLPLRVPRLPVTERLLNAYLAEFPPPARKRRTSSARRAEIIFVVSGSLAVTVGSDEHVLHQGDSITSIRRHHSYRRIARRRARPSS